MSEPSFREFSFTIQQADKDAECIQLLTRVMESCKDADHEAVTAWFKKRYDKLNSQ